MLNIFYNIKAIHPIIGTNGSRYHPNWQNAHLIKNTDIFPSIITVEDSVTAYSLKVSAYSLEVYFTDLTCRLAPSAGSL
jgi:hypothetical protein